jgi:hypothetical protein
MRDGTRGVLPEFTAHVPTLGTNEQTTVEGFGEAVRFYMTVMVLAAG